jgi:hypothetical protein
MEILNPKITELKSRPKRATLSRIFLGGVGGAGSVLVDRLLGEKKMRELEERASTQSKATTELSNVMTRA